MKKLRFLAALLPFMVGLMGVIHDVVQIKINDTLIPEGSFPWKQLVDVFFIVIGAIGIIRAVINRRKAGFKSDLSMRAIFSKIYDVLFVDPPRDVMVIRYDVVLNKLECLDWTSQRIEPFCGKFTPELWKQIESFCRSRNRANRAGAYTTIYIWAGGDRKHLAYNEPVENYFRNPELLKTGQGYHHGSEKSIHRHKVCKECGHEEFIYHGALDEPCKIHTKTQ